MRTIANKMTAFHANTCIHITFTHTLQNTYATG